MDLERYRDILKQGHNIVEVVTAGQREMTKMWTSTQKRERPEIEVPEDTDTGYTGSPTRIQLMSSQTCMKHSSQVT